MSETHFPEVRFPIRLVRAALIAMGLLIGATVWLTWHVNNKIREIAGSQDTVQTLAQELRHEGKVVTLYVRLAAETGDHAYVSQYHTSLQRIRLLIQQLQHAIKLDANSQTLRQIAALDRELARLERRALALASEGRRAEARAILNDDRYAALFDAYAAGALQIRRRSAAFVQSTRAEMENYLSANLVSAMLMFVIVALTWLLVVRPARKWGAALEDARAAAARATKAKSEFLAVMSHEIRTPLNSIIGFAELLLTSGKLRPEERHQVELIEGAGAMLLTVVNDLLDFSKVEAGKIELSPEPFAIETLVDNAVSIMRGTAEGKGLELRADIDPRLSTYYLGDENRLRQALLNLLNNAVKFTSAGTVSLAVALNDSSSEGDGIRFTVTDTGEGIGAEQQKRLFQPFMQADASITRKFGGTGLGLSISKKLVELMGGEIGFSSVHGRGSCFWFELRLPRADAPAFHAAHELAPASRAARILVAEDLAMNQELARAAIERAGHQVDIAADGAEAVRAVQERKYDLVLMDIQMPRMDGISATKAIRALDGFARDIPILAVTANVLPDQVREFIAAGMDGHVAKPFRQKELHAAIAAALAGRKMDAATSARQAPALDEEVFESVLESLPIDSLGRHVKALQKDVEELASASPDDATDLQATAHKIVSQAGMIGLMRLSTAARGVEYAAREGGDLAFALEAFRKSAGDIDKELWPRLKEDTKS